MSCLAFTVNPAPSLEMTIGSVTALALNTERVTEQPALSLEAFGQPQLSVEPTVQSVVDVAPVQQLQLHLGEVCTVSGGRLVVLAAADGILRTRDGGFFLLDPALHQ